MHLELGLAVLMANSPAAVSGGLILVLCLHFRLRYPINSSLLILVAGGRFSLPAEGRFDLMLDEATRVGSFWAEIVFSDRPNSQFLLLRDQLPEPDWRRLCLILRELV